MPVNFVPGIVHDDLWIQKEAANQVGLIRTGTMQDARRSVVGIGVNDDTPTNIVTPAGSHFAEHELGPEDATVTLRVRASNGTGSDQGGNELFSIADRRRSLAIGWKRRGVAKAHTRMIISNITEPETYAHEAVFTVTLRPGPDNIATRGTDLYDTRAADGTVSGAVDAQSTEIYAG